MIEHYKIYEDFSLMFSNEPSSELDHMLNLAKTDSSNPLFENYQNIKLEDFLFHNIVLYKNKPIIFYGIQRDPWMPDYAARGYTKLYKDSEFKDSRFLISKFSTKFKKEFNYFTYNKWTDLYGIKTIFFTRNLQMKEDASRMWKYTGWKQYPYICKINFTHQYVYWDGEEKLDFLIPYQDIKIPEDT